jgi:hypothetical protein
VVNEQNGGMRGARERANAVEDDAHFCCGILVGAMKANQRVEKQKPWPGLVEGGAQTIEAIGKPDGGLDDDVNGQALQGCIVRAGQCLQALQDHGLGIFGTQQGDRAGGVNGKLADARGARGDGDAQFKGEEALATLGGASENAGAGFEEQALCNPLQGLGGTCEVGGTDGCVGLSGHQACS